MSAALDQHYKNLMGNLNGDGGGMVGWRERDKRWGRDWRRGEREAVIGM